MKLGSIEYEGRNRGVIVIGAEVLDATFLLEILEEKGQWIDVTGGPPHHHHVEGLLVDAIGLVDRGMDWLTALAARLDDEILRSECREKGALKPLNAVRWNAPVIAPGKILAIGLNYRAHAAEGGARLPESPLVFSKCASALLAPGADIRLPGISEFVDYEAELAVVIGKTARSVPADAARDYVGGYTIMNDVTARDLQRREKQWTRAKGLDTFAPCGPWLVTPDEIADPLDLKLELRLNGELRQSSNTVDLIFGVPALIEFISQDLTLYPGDIISTGTPAGVGAYMEPPRCLKPGDLIEITISGIGTLSNRVAGR